MDLVLNIFDYLADLSGPLPYILIFFTLFLCGFGVPIPEDIILITAGYLAYEEESILPLMVVVCYLGVMMGDTTIFYLGRRWGMTLAQKWPFRHLLHPERMDQIEKKLQEHSYKVIFTARFMPGLRSAVFFCCGCFNIPFRTFFFLDGLAALLSVPTIVGVTYYFGEHIDRAIEIIKRVENSIVIVILGLFLIFFLKWFLPRYLASRKSK
jgi:membrane protein DedA with SNARE-associated domain